MAWLYSIIRELYNNYYSQFIKTMRLLKRFWIPLLIILLSIPSVFPLFSDGFFSMHDDTQVARVYEMGKALKDGMFPVRWVADLGYGYGYPIFNFYSPLPYYIGGFFTLIGFDALIATKLMMGLGIVLSGIFMYFLAREFWGEWGGIVSALFYVYAPYHALDIYVRGAVGEVWAYAFLPLMALGFYRVIKGDWGGMTLGAVGFAGVILSHNLTAMMIAPLVIVALLYCFIVQKNKKILNTYYLILTTALGFLLSAFYWLPALTEMKYTNVLSQIGGGADFRDHFVCLSQLWSSQWGFGGSVPGCIDGMSFRIGKIYIITSLVAVILGLILVRRRIIFYVFLGFIVSIFLTLQISKPIWESIPQMAFFQYPWRFLILSSFFSSFLAGSLILGARFLVKKVHYEIILSILLLVFLLLFNFKLFVPKTILSKTSSDYTSELSLKWTTSKISDEYMPKDFAKPENPSEIVKEKITSPNDVQIKKISDKTQELSAEITASEQSGILIQTAYFPSWNVFVNGEKSGFKVLNKGIEVPLASGNYLFELVFIQTPVEKIGNIMSVAGVILLILGIIYRRNEKT